MQPLPLISSYTTLSVILVLLLFFVTRHNAKEINIYFRLYLNYIRFYAFSEDLDFILKRCISSSAYRTMRSVAHFLQREFRSSHVSQNLAISRTGPQQSAVLCILPTTDNIVLIHSKHYHYLPLIICASEHL